MPFIALEKRDKLEDGYCRRIKVQRQTLLLIQSQGQLFLIDALCPHGQASLAKGTIGDGCIRCPKHGIVFDLTTGGAVGGEAVSDIAPLTTYPLEDRDGVIGVNWHS